MAVRKNTIVAHLSIFVENIKLSLLSAMEYKVNFIMQTIGMIINNVFWIALWWLLFMRFENINGWVFKDMILLYSLLTIVFGLTSTFFYGARKMFKTIAEGRLDYYLTLPKNVLFHSSLKTSYSAIGDVIFGIILLPFAITIYQLPLFIYFTITGTILFLSMGIIFNSLAFFIGNSDRAVLTADMGFLTFASYPFSAFGGLTKFFLLTIFPAGFVTGIPIEIMKEFSWKWLGISTLVSLIFLGLAIIIFYWGLRKYESGNLLYAKD